MNTHNILWICSGNTPNAAIQNPKIARHDEKRRQPPLLMIKYAEDMSNIPNMILTRLNMVAAGCINGNIPPISLKLLVAILYPGNSDSPMFTTNIYSIPPITNKIPAIL